MDYVAHIGCPDILLSHNGGDELELFDSLTDNGLTVR